MAEYKLLMPKMGESVIEATILSWNKKVGDKVHEQDTILEVATDKVDTEVPSPVNGVIKQLLHDVNATVPIGEALAIIEIEGNATIQFMPEKKKENTAEITPPNDEKKKEELVIQETTKAAPEIKQEAIQPVQPPIEKAKTYVAPAISSVRNKYYSPLVLSIAQAENISMLELETIVGNGIDNRVTKEDILGYVEKKKQGLIQPKIITTETKETPELKENKTSITSEILSKENTIAGGANIEIIEMDRMRKLISQHMTNSKKTAAHVTSVMECDVTNIVRWREKNKASFQKRENFGLTFMPIFVQAITKAIQDYPMINISVDGDKIIRKKDINIGIATALPTGNLIVPVVKNKDQKSLLGIARLMNELVLKARSNSLQPDDVMDGTYTITNIGSFGNIIGTPIINQPQVAIMAVGAITKKPAVLEMDGQDVIAIRHMMYLSHTYDHRVVDGQLGGLFVKKVSEYLEKFDIHQEI
mgnify:FL=1